MEISLENYHHKHDFLSIYVFQLRGESILEIFYTFPILRKLIQRIKFYYISKDFKNI